MRTSVAQVSFFARHCSRKKNLGSCCLGICNHLASVEAALHPEFLSFLERGGHTCSQMQDPFHHGTCSDCHYDESACCRGVCQGAVLEVVPFPSLVWEAACQPNHSLPLASESPLLQMKCRCLDAGV